MKKASSKDTTKKFKKTRQVTSQSLAKGGIWGFNETTCEDIYKKYATKLNAKYNEIIDKHGNYYAIFKTEHDMIMNDVLDMYNIIVKIGTDKLRKTATNCKKHIYQLDTKKYKGATTFSYAGYIEDFFGLANKALTILDDEIKKARLGSPAMDILSEQDITKLTEEMTATIIKLNMLQRDIFAVFGMDIEAMSSMSAVLNFMKTRLGLDTIQAIALAKKLSTFKSTLVPGDKDVIHKYIKFFFEDAGLLPDNYVHLVDMFTRLYFVVSRHRFILSHDFMYYTKSPSGQLDPNASKPSRGEFCKEAKIISLNNKHNKTSCGENTSKTITKDLDKAMFDICETFASFSSVSTVISKYSPKQSLTSVYTKKFISKMSSLFSTGIDKNTSPNRHGLFEITNKHDPKKMTAQVVISNDPNINGVYINITPEFYEKFALNAFKKDVNEALHTVMNVLANQKCTRLQMLNFISDIVDYCQYKANCPKIGGGKKTISMVCPAGKMYNVPVRQLKYFESIGFKQYGGANDSEGGPIQSKGTPTIGLTSIGIMGSPLAADPVACFTCCADLCAFCSECNC